MSPLFPDTTDATYFSFIPFFLSNPSCDAGNAAWVDESQTSEQANVPMPFESEDFVSPTACTPELRQVRPSSQGSISTP
jgi:hypothetical protein